MKHAITIFLFCLGVLVYSSSALAQEDAVNGDAAPSAVTPDDHASLDARLALAKDLHQYIPTADKINNAIDNVSLQLPTDRRESFRSAMRNVLNYRVIEKISIDTMAELFTQEELDYLLEYYKDPLSQSVDEKFEKYEAAMAPEITRMLDKAMMRVRTGGSAP